ncbi:MAG: hypothetical protein ACP5H3_04025 [Candidatus Aenigmatarchaeota archaeon]
MEKLLLLDEGYLKGYIKMYAILMGNEGWGEPSYILWVHPELTKFDEEWDFYVTELPSIGAKIQDEKNENKILIPDKNWWVSYVFFSSGKKGITDFEILFPKSGIEIFPFQFKRSLSNKKGISKGALINVPMEYNKVIVKYTKTQGKKTINGFKVYFSNGKVEDLTSVEDLN